MSDRAGRDAPDSVGAAGEGGSGPEPERPGTPPGPMSAEAPCCDLCGAVMLDRHCRLVCLRCGYQRDCSDP